MLPASSRLLLLLLAAVALAAGCTPTAARLREEYFLNPDGSGKVRVAVRFRAYAEGWKPKPQTREALMEKFLSARKDSRGVDAVRDVRVRPGADGWHLVAYTAYFRDVSALVIEPLSVMAFRLRLEPRRDGALLTVTYPPVDNIAKSLDKSIRRAISKGEQEKFLAQQRKEMDDKDFFRLLEEYDLDITVHLPGLLRAHGHLAAPDGRTVRLRLTGRRMAAAVRAAYGERTLRKAVEDGAAAPVRRAALVALFGTDGPRAAELAAPLAPLFDYARERDAARAAEQAMLNKLKPLPGKGK